MLALIALMMQFYQALSMQIETHDENRYQIFTPMESNWIRLQDRVQQGDRRQRAGGHRLKRLHNKRGSYIILLTISLCAMMILVYAVIYASGQAAIGSTVRSFGALWGAQHSGRV